jgi:transposase-like protein
MYTVCLINKSKAEGFADHSASETFTMIILVRVCLKEVSDKGKSFQWIKPSKCPSCNSSQFWGHGFLLAYFTGFALGLWLKRYRCNTCKAVITFRPSGYFSRFQSSAKDISGAILAKLNTSKWPVGLPRQRCGQWLRRFTEFIRIQYGDDNEGQTLAFRLMKLHTSACKFMVEIA